MERLIKHIMAICLFALLGVFFLGFGTTLIILINTNVISESLVAIHIIFCAAGIIFLGLAAYWIFRKRVF